MQFSLIATITVLSVLGGIESQPTEKVATCPSECKCPSEDPSKLDCSQAMLSVLPTLMPNHKFTKIDLSNNEIRDLNEQFSQNYETLEDINLSNNLLERVPEWFPRKLTSLQHLKLSNNSISDVSREKFEHLKHMCLNNNPLGKLFINAPELKLLNLKNCNMTELHKHFFENLPNLEVLDVSGNPLPENLNLQAFDSVKNLKNVTLPANINAQKLDLLRFNIITESQHMDHHLINNHENEDPKSIKSEKLVSANNVTDATTEEVTTEYSSTMVTDERYVNLTHSEEVESDEITEDSYDFENNNYTTIDPENTYSQNANLFGNDEIMNENSENMTTVKQEPAEPRMFNYFDKNEIGLDESIENSRKATEITQLEPVTGEPIVQKKKQEDNLTPPLVNPINDMLEINMTTVATKQMENMNPSDNINNEDTTDTQEEDKNEIMAASAPGTGNSIDTALIGVILAVIVLVAVVIIAKKNWPKIKRSMRSGRNRQQEQPLPEEMPLKA